MNANHNDQLGMTWRKPAVGMTWLSAAMLAVFALIAGLTSPAAAGSAEGAAVPVGTLTTSMVEMLGAESGNGVVELSRLRRLTRRSADIGSGEGIDVALIDTGVSPVDGLEGRRLIHGPDLSFEGSSPEAAYLDTYGHGTHMAGIIAGRRQGARGIAPKARIVSVKVAGHDGITTVPQVVAAIDWVVEHRNTDGLNIRVLNLSLGQAGVSSHEGDILSAAVERAWNAGIFVVVAAGNRGETQKHLDSPAIDPFVVAVGAADGTNTRRRNLFEVPNWSAQGDGVRNPDLVGTGRSIASYRVPGSTVDVAAPQARFGQDFFRGSGSSQAAASVSGLAAAFLSTHPQMTNDDLKLTLVEGSDELRNAGEDKAGSGLIDGRDSARSLLSGVQAFEPAAGAHNGIVTPTGATWSGGSWNGATWSGATWSGMTWSGGSWSGATWSGATWSSATWSGATWSGATWSGATWSGATWSGATWSGATWSDAGWIVQRTPAHAQAEPPAQSARAAVAPQTPAADARASEAPTSAADALVPAQPEPAPVAATK